MANSDLRVQQGQEFAALLRLFRERAACSQEQLAARAELAVRTIRNLESGSGRPYLSTVHRLAGALQLDASARGRFVAAAEQARGVSTAYSLPDRSNLPPAQLPADVIGFVGRDEQLKQLDELLLGGVTAEGVGRTAVVSAVSGTPGVGKTALAVRWAHRAAGAFPDGQLYVNLRGYDPIAPLMPVDALGRLLSAVGVARGELPSDVEDRAALFRSETARRRILILLDNAVSAEQVRPMLPGTSRSVVLVTSRDLLAGLVARDGAYRIELDLLALEDSVRLLRHELGARVDAEQNAAAALAELCCRLPLALRVAAELAARRGNTSLSELAAELADHRRRLNLLDADGDPRASVASVFGWSVRQLPTTTAEAFALVRVYPGTAIDAYGLAALLGTDLDEAAEHLQLLAQAHLVYAASGGRFGIHDLLRAYGLELAESLTGTRAADPALTRLFDYYLAAALARWTVFIRLRRKGARSLPRSSALSLLSGTWSRPVRGLTQNLATSPTWSCGLVATGRRSLLGFPG